jgi:hypothetical protein
VQPVAVDAERDRRHIGLVEEEGQVGPFDRVAVGGVERSSSARIRVQVQVSPSSRQPSENWELKPSQPVSATQAAGIVATSRALTIQSAS